eukprot:TRINITY_DN18672_c0_g1_i1.p1 TRINITY_DN18672_c0_g1~~TRINITY_DN18672_c0_g1_i1.p1  ORF type:complete len:453 (+),score=67.91 TRINITY_DN18672_c0_g1_i1:96-1454(+)
MCIRDRSKRVKDNNQCRTPCGDAAPMEHCGGASLDLAVAHTLVYSCAGCTSGPVIGDVDTCNGLRAGERSFLAKRPAGLVDAAPATIAAAPAAIVIEDNPSCTWSTCTRSCASGAQRLLAATAEEAPPEAPSSSSRRLLSVPSSAEAHRPKQGQGFFDPLRRRRVAERRRRSTSWILKGYIDKDRDCGEGRTCDINGRGCKILPYGDVVYDASKEGCLKHCQAVCPDCGYFGLQQDWGPNNGKDTAVTEAGKWRNQGGYCWCGATVATSSGPVSPNDPGREVNGRACSTRNNPNQALCRSENLRADEICGGPRDSKSAYTMVYSIYRNAPKPYPEPSSVLSNGGAWETLVGTFRRRALREQRARAQCGSLALLTGVSQLDKQKYCWTCNDRGACDRNSNYCSWNEQRQPFGCSAKQPAAHCHQSCCFHPAGASESRPPRALQGSPLPRGHAM